jgi:hypothetical protein
MSRFKPCDQCGLYPCVCGAITESIDTFVQQEIQCIICGDIVDTTDLASFSPPICILCDEDDWSGV